MGMLYYNLDSLDSITMGNAKLVGFKTYLNTIKNKETITRNCITVPEQSVSF